MAEYTTDFEKHGAYSFDKAALTDLWNAANRFTEGTATIRVELEDNHKVESKEISEILDDPYVKHKKIVRVSIDGTNVKRDPWRRISIILRGRSSLGPVNMVVSGDRGASVLAREEIENIVQGRSQWYSRFMLPDGPFYLTTTIVATVIILFGALYAFHTFVLPLRKELVEVLFWNELIALFLLLVFLKTRLFPKMVFNIGKSAEVEKSANYWRNFVGIVLIAGIIVALLGGAIVEKLFK